MLVIPNKILFFLIIFSILIVHLLFCNEIAISLDDVPYPSSILFKKKTRSHRILMSLKQTKCPPIGIFTIGLHLKKFGFKEVLNYAANRNFIYNHSYQHLNLNTTQAQYFIDDLKKNHNILSLIPNFEKFFRFPYLSIGDKNKRKIILKTLNQMGYKDGYVTVKTADYFINYLLQKNLKAGKSINYKNLKKTIFRSYMELYKIL